MKKLNSWFEIDEHEYLMYLLKGYEINVDEKRILFMFTEPYKHLTRIVYHREDGPASIHKDGTKTWYLNGQKHREDGPAVIFGDGSMEWWLNNELHRTDGPAVMLTNGELQWRMNHQYHREDGPAIIWPDGSKSWYLNGEKHTEAEFNEEIKQLV